MPVNFIFFLLYAAKPNPKWFNNIELLKLFSVEHPSRFPTFLNFVSSPNTTNADKSSTHYP